MSSTIEGLCPSNSPAGHDALHPHCRKLVSIYKLYTSKGGLGGLRPPSGIRTKPLLSHPPSFHFSQVTMWRTVSRLMLAVVFLGLACTQALAAPAFETRQAVSDLFAARSINGTFVAHDPASGRFVGHNAERAATRFVPASTFKIPNSLIGLTVGAVNSVDEVFYRHDGQPKYLKTWERDANLRDAITVSNVPAYQTLARRIGLEAMAREVRQLGYGNADIGPTVDTFWLEGPLRISAQEQAVFLARLAAGQLPCPLAAQQAVAEICALERGQGWTLYGKTGLASLPEGKTGWFVGWVARDGRVTSFALNMDMGTADLAERVNLAKASLRALNILPKP